MRISLDAMGSDGAPGPEVAGALAAIGEDRDLEILLVGDEAAIVSSLADHPSNSVGDRLQVVHTPERIRSSDSPIASLRQKPDSSIAIGVRQAGEGESDAFVSAGSTGAVMAASLLGFRPLEGVERPALAAPFPTRKGRTLVLDVGANIQCKAHNLLQFAHLATIYMQDVEGIRRPRVGLLNVGAEEVRGTSVLQQSHQLLSDSALDFIGNVEGHDILQGVCDVLVCDGLNGNVLLKFYESLTRFFHDSIQPLFSASAWQGTPTNFFRTFDYAEYGGVPLMGLKGVSVVCHGRSSPRAIERAIGVAARTVRTGMVAHMTRELAAAAKRVTA